MKSKANIFLLALSLLIPLVSIKAASTNNLNGRILLQVESHGEAWYVNPKDGKKYYMADGNQAFQIMKTLGVGMSNKDIEKMKTDVNFRKKFIGKILLQVESHGEAYYISFDGRYNYLKDGASAYQVMRKLGLGASNANLNKITEYKIVVKESALNVVKPKTLITDILKISAHYLPVTDSDIEIYNLAVSKLDSAMCSTIKIRAFKGGCLATIEQKRGSKHPCEVLGNNYPELADDCERVDGEINNTTIPFERDVKTISNVKQIQTALELYYNDAGKYPATINFGSPLIYQKYTYISAIPTASVGVTSACLTNFQYKYTYVDDNKYTLTYCIDGVSNSSKGFSVGTNTATPAGIK